MRKFVTAALAAVLTAGTAFVAQAESVPRGATEATREAQARVRCDAGFQRQAELRGRHARFHCSPAG